MYAQEELSTMSPKEISNMLYSAAARIAKIEAFISELEQVRKKYRPTEGGYKELWHGMKPFWKKVGVVLVAIAILAALDHQLTAFIQILFLEFGFSANMSIMLVSVLQILVVITALVLAQIYANKMIVKHNMKNADRLEYNKQYNRQVYAEEMAVKEKLSQAKMRYSELSHLLPYSYRYDKDALRYMASVLEDGRTDSLGGAINLYEEHAHRMRMEAKQDELIRQQQEANRIAAAGVMATMEAAAAADRQAQASWAAAAAAANRR